MKLTEALLQGYGVKDEKGNVKLVKKVSELVVDVEVKGGLYCSDNQLTSLEINHAIGGDLYCSRNQLTSLEINHAIGGRLDCYNNQLTSTPIFVRLTQGQRGNNWIYADNMLMFFKRVRTLNDLTVYYGLFDNVVITKDNSTFSHGKDVKTAIIDLQFKLAKRDINDYKSLTLNSKLTYENAVVMYRVITGACQYGTQQFLEQNKIQERDYTVAEIIELTKGHYGSESFKRFFGGAIND